MDNDAFAALDACFEARGLSARPTPLNTGRTWQGVIDGRNVVIVCSRRSRTKYHGADLRSRVYAGHECSMEVSTPLQTRLTATPRSIHAVAGLLDRWLGPRMGLFPLDPPSPELAHLNLAAFEASWAQPYLLEGRVQRVLTEVLAPADAQQATFALQPGFALARCRLPLEAITPAFAERRLDALLEAVALAEAMPAPERIATPSRIESVLRVHPFLMIAALFAALVASSLVLVAVLLAIAYAGLQGYVVLAGVGYWLWRRNKKQRAAKADAVSA
ncbi:MAG: hypothetical protein R2834_08255 [Rhodothermales bacterium]